MSFDEIETIVILVQKNGSAHQVLTSKENKVALRMIAIQDESLKLDKEIMPVVFTIKSNQ
jgi:hypothetical protein